MIQSQTENCVICGKTAVQFTGHVHKDKEEVIAGLCEEHKDDKLPLHGHPMAISAGFNGCAGCFGQWIPAYGYVRQNQI